MKNITVTVPDETYLQARIWAARNSTSVSVLVRQFLESLDELPVLALITSDERLDAEEIDPPPPYLS